MASPGELDSPLEGSDSETGGAGMIREAQNWQEDSAVCMKGTCLWSQACHCDSTCCARGRFQGH